MEETVFYFDVLGFGHKAMGSSESAVDALESLAILLGTDAIGHLTGRWDGQYALSDSVFLTHKSAETAVRQAAILVSNLVSMTPAGDEPLLVRGALVHGAVRHLKGIFLKNQERANLVGPAVVEAVALEESSGLKGPRIMVAEDLVRTLPPSLVGWLLRPTSASAVWEVLWLLPVDPSGIENDAVYIRTFCAQALALLRTHGGNPVYGAHYREFLLLAARSAKRISEFEEAGKIPTPPVTFFRRSEVSATCEATSGLPEDYVAKLMRVIESIPQAEKG